MYMVYINLYIISHEQSTINTYSAMSVLRHPCTMVFRSEKATEWTLLRCSRSSLPGKWVLTP